METVFAIFALGLMVSLVVAKGIMQANDFTKQELQQKSAEDPVDKTPG